MFNKAYGQSPTLSQDIQNVLMFAHNSEYIGMFLYDNALKQSTLVPSADTAAITLMRNDEMGHIKFLKQTAAQFGVTNLPTLTADMFDYTGGKGAAGGPFADVNTNYATFLGVAQGIEDNDVRAYKGGAPTLMPNNTLLEGALNIHSVEARHASHVRSLRRGGPTAVADTSNLMMKPKSWISGTDGGGPKPPVTTPIYVGEDNVMQGSVDVSKVSSTTAVPAAAAMAAASEAFDEPLALAAAKANARTFVKPPYDTQYFA